MSSAQHPLAITLSIKIVLGTNSVLNKNLTPPTRQNSKKLSDVLREAGFSFEPDTVSAEEML